jgi:8-oxo-dGTP pyrophosphatase MutT (NUDIX family)
MPDHLAAYAQPMDLPVALRRQAFRSAYFLLRFYWYVWRPHKTGVKCVLTDGDRVLLVRHTYGGRSWDFPGGAIKRREQPVEAAHREMHEELGVCIRTWLHLGRIQGTMHRRRDTVHCFQAELHGPISIDQAELSTADWFPRHRLPSDLSRYVGPILSHVPAAGGTQRGA